MKKYFTQKNLGWLMTAGLGLLLTMSALSKFGPNSTTVMHSEHIAGWWKYIAIGELLSLILFIIPQTMRLGALMLSAYFGGAIIFHMAHPDASNQVFLSPVGFLIFIWATTWIRGTKLIGDY